MAGSRGKNAWSTLPAPDGSPGKSGVRGVDSTEGLDPLYPLSWDDEPEPFKPLDQRWPAEVLPLLHPRLFRRKGTGQSQAERVLEVTLLSLADAGCLTLGLDRRWQGHRLYVFPGDQPAPPRRSGRADSPWLVEVLPAHVSANPGIGVGGLKSGHHYTSEAATARGLLVKGRAWGLVPKLQPSPDALAASEAAAAALSDRWHAFVDEYPDLHSALNRDLQSTDFQVPT